jgi:hypothetical protein
VNPNIDNRHAPRSADATEGQQDVAEVSTALRIVLLYRPLLRPLAE